MKTTHSIKSIRRNLCVITTVFFAVVLICSSVLFTLALEVDTVENGTSAYIGTIFYEDVPVMTAGGGYRFYNDVNCTDYAVGGSHEVNTESDYSIYFKADDGYEITNVALSYADGTVCPNVISETQADSGVYHIYIPKETQLAGNLKLYVDVKLIEEDNPIKANFALLEWKAKGESGSLTFTLENRTYTVSDTSTYATAYQTIFEKLWDQAEDYQNVSQETELATGVTKIWRIQNTTTNTLSADLIIHEGATVIFLCEEAATINVTSDGKITLGGGFLSVQGKNGSAKLTFDGGGVSRKGTLNNSTAHAINNDSRENLIQIRFGSAFFEYAHLTGVKSTNKAGTGTQVGALQILAYKSTRANLFVSDMLFDECSATSGAAFNGHTTNLGTQIYFYNSIFNDCTATGTVNNSGGGAVRGGSGRGLYTFQKCEFQDNSLKGNKSSANGYHAGGAVRWNIGNDGLHTGVFNACSFTNNISEARGGAIYSTGGLQLNACTLIGNEAAVSGGAVFVATHTQNTSDSSVVNEEINGSVIFGPGTVIANNESKLGGAIHFNVSKSLAGKYVRKGYDLRAIVKGAQIYDNTATQGGGIAVTVTYGYVCGVYVHENSSIYGNTALAEGGAIYIDSDNTYITNYGFNIYGGAIYRNQAENGGVLYLKEGPVIISGGSITENASTVNGGAIYMGGGELMMSGGTVSQNSAQNGAGAYLAAGSMTVSGGVISNNTASVNGGGAYLGGGKLTVSGGEMTSNNALNGGGAYLKAGTMTVSGGEIKNNDAEKDGGAAYLEGGSFAMSGGTISGNTAQNGAAAFVADGNVTVEGGLIENNTASQNGGAFSISNGGYTMTGGTLNGNRATSGNGGAIYISSSEDTTVTIRSGSITNNFAGTSGGALAVVGQAEVTLTITIGSNTDHTGRVDHHAKAEGNANEACPVIKENNSLTSGGGIYLAGSYTAKMNMYCLVEADNAVGVKGTDAYAASSSNFMKVEGGTLNISTKEGENESCGNVVINSTIHVTGGKVSLSGSSDNPIFNEAVTVDVENKEDFTDDRVGGSARTIQYFESFQESGQYILLDYKIVGDNYAHTVRRNTYSNPGYKMIGWKLEADGVIYNANDIVTIPNDLVFYAVWEKIEYVIVFSPGYGDYDGSTNEQPFELGETQKLNLNGFVVFGKKFVNWLDGSTGKTYLDGASFTWPSDSTGTTITLTAQWTECDHLDFSAYTLIKSKSSVERKCACQAYTETITIQGVNGVYTGEEHSAKHTHTTNSQNEISMPATGTWHGYIVYYNGVSNGDIELVNSQAAPINACEDKDAYTASITVEHNGKEITISAPIMIVRAERTEIPDEPQYSQSGNVITVENPNDPRNFVLAYQFSWYVEDQLKKSDWISWDPTKAPLDPLPSKTMDETWSNYSVDVCYAQTFNYKASQVRQGTKSFVWTGEVTIIIKCDPSSGLAYSRVDPDDNADATRAGITVTLVPVDNTYYVYNVATPNISITPNKEGTDVSAFTRPKIDNISMSGESWVVWIHDIKNAEELNIDGGVTVEIVFCEGGEKKVVINSSATKNEVFDNIAENGEGKVTISRDSAYTVNFDVEYFKHYSDPTVEFGEMLPQGTTIIMRDFSDSSYWSYTVDSEGITSVSLGSFVRMGTNAPFTIGSRDAFTLQFAIDFSNCETTLSADALTTTFAADRATDLVPDISTSQTITLVNAPSFTLNTQGESENFSQTVLYQFAYSEEAGVGISKWNDACGILVVEPSIGSAPLPPDARLRVKIGNSTRTYSFINGKFMVVLPSIGSDTAEITLLSDMLPNETQSFAFSVKLCVSATQIKTTPVTASPMGEASVIYQTQKSIIPAIHAQLEGELPKYVKSNEGATISSLAFSGFIANYSELPNGCYVRTVLYAKNSKSPNGGYETTSQESKLTVNSDGSFAGTVSFDSFIEEMKDSVGTLSLMLSVEVVDQTGKVINSVPMYFILIDTRQ